MTTVANPAAHGDIAAHVADPTTQVAVHEAGEKRHTVRRILGVIARSCSAWCSDCRCCS